MKSSLQALCSFALLGLAACQLNGSRGDSKDSFPLADVANSTSVHGVIDAWHTAAANVDAEAYLDLLSEDATFLGTDPGERWDKAGFRAYVEHFFIEQKRGWKYVPSRRHVMFDETGRMAWFDERLENAGYGVLRGTGVLRLEADGWNICHYSMTFAIPNRLARRVADLAQSAESSSEGETGEAADTEEENPVQNTTGNPDGDSAETSPVSHPQGLEPATDEPR